MRNVLITGGAGFIGSHVADALLAAGYGVKALDNLDPQVHPQTSRPEYLDRRVELIHGDIRNREMVDQVLREVDAVVHFVAAVGVGQSMYEIEHYTDVNNRGTAVLLEALIENPVKRLVVASSMSIYGEGLYETQDGEQVIQSERPVTQLREGQWEPMDKAGRPLRPLPTPESKPPCLSSIYALSKYDQERMCMLIGRAYDIPTTALRFFNVYGPRQALSNPYTGVLAIFAARLLNNRAPMIFEDGEQRRDFVSVYDIARGVQLALEHPDAPDNVFNLGSGQAFTVREVAQKLAQVMGKDIEPEITGRYRTGDIRHCYADISLAREVLGYEPQVVFEEAIEELAAWVKQQKAEDMCEQAAAELAARGLAI